MVKLPKTPFKMVGHDESHPLVKEALRDRKPYEPCWCGSGRKFKKCHRIREGQSALPLGRILHDQSRIFWRRRGCMHPHASAQSCSGDVIDAHSIQRQGVLRKLIGEDNHVYRFGLSPTGVTVTPIGWKKASIFPGYCAKHDSRIFSPLERTGFSGTHEQCVLQAYRCVCNELYKRRALIDSLRFQRDLIDRGCNLDEQINRQLSIVWNIASQEKSEEELCGFWRKFDDAIALGNYDRFISKCYFFEGNLGVTSASALHTEFDFQGNLMMDMWDLEVDAEILSHSIMATEGGGAIIFVWLAEERTPSLVVSSFEEIANDERGDVFVQYCFLNCENNYFSRKWWEKLDPALQAQLKRYSAALHYEGGPFVPNERRLVSWEFSV